MLQNKSGKFMVKKVDKVGKVEKLKRGESFGQKWRNIYIYDIYTKYIHGIYKDIQCISCAYAPPGG
jgi:hypothetical protein